MSEIRFSIFGGVESIKEGWEWERCGGRKCRMKISNFRATIVIIGVRMKGRDFLKRFGRAYRVAWRGFYFNFST